jgi:hypothetical protein
LDGTRIWRVKYIQPVIMKVLSKAYFLAVLAKKKFPLSQNQLDGTRIWRVKYIQLVTLNPDGVMNLSHTKTKCNAANAVLSYITLQITSLFTASIRYVELLFWYVGGKIQYLNTYIKVIM